MEDGHLFAQNRTAILDAMDGLSRKGLVALDYEHYDARCFRYLGASR